MNTSLLGFCAALGLTIATSFGAAAYKGLALASLPSAVQRAIKDQLKDGAIASIEEAADTQDAAYEVEIRQKGRERSIAIREDGSLSREQVFIEETPAAVRHAIEEELGGGELVQVDKFPSDTADETTFDIEMTKSGRDRRFEVDAQGQMLEIEVFLDELPSVARKTVQKRVGAGRLGDIYKVIEDEETTFEVSMTRHRHELPFSVGSDGRLLNAALLLEEVPDPVRKAIGARVGSGYMEGIDASYDDGRATYTVTVTRGDDTETFEVSAEGKVLPDADAPVDAGKTRT